MKEKGVEVVCEPEKENTEVCQEHGTMTTTVMDEGEQQQNVDDATTVTVEEIEEALGSSNYDSSTPKDTSLAQEEICIEKNEVTEKVM